MHHRKFPNKVGVFVAVVNGWKLLNIVARSFILNMTGLFDSPLKVNCKERISKT